MYLSKVRLINQSINAFISVTSP